MTKEKALEYVQTVGDMFIEDRCMDLDGQDEKKLKEVLDYLEKELR